MNRTGISSLVSSIGYVVVRRAPYVSVHNAVIVIRRSSRLPTETLTRGLSELSHAVTQNVIGDSNNTLPDPFIPSPLVTDTSTIVCFDEWVENYEVLSFPSLLCIFSILTMLCAIYFFLALPETDGALYYML